MFIRTILKDGALNMKYITLEQSNAIKKVSYFNEGFYSNLDIDKTIDYMTQRYVQPCMKRLNITQATVADCAAGFGWVSFAFLYAGVKKAYLIEPDKDRLEAAREIAKIIGVEARCEFIHALLQEVHFPADSVDIFASIETLEHVGKTNVKDCVKTIARITRSVVLLTTPNQLFPIVAHDTALPFAHWLPSWLRKPYAYIFRKGNKDFGNHFLAPWDLQPLYYKFKPDSQYTMFSSLDEFDSFYPHYLPYGSKQSRRHRKQPSIALRSYIETTGRLLGNYAFALSPNLASVWVSRHSSK